MGHRGALHPATVPFFKWTVKARGKLFCKWNRETDTHTRTTQGSWGGDFWAYREAAVTILTQFVQGMWAPPQLLSLFMWNHAHAWPWRRWWQGKQPPNCDWLLPHFDNPKWEDISVYIVGSPKVPGLYSSTGMSLLKVTSWRWFLNHWFSSLTEGNLGEG